MAPRASLVFLFACLAAAAAPLLPSPPAPAAAGFPGWPAQFEGRPLRQLPLTALEERFAENFPGRLGRFSDGESEIILRWVAHETRRLHPAADCFKANGYELTPQPIEVNANGVRWGRFLARRGATTLSVRERLYDTAGNSWTDVSSWYWAAFWDRSSGPWWAVTVARAKIITKPDFE
jgi:hypothetical protein